jgi:hypothetical protein
MNPMESYEATRCAGLWAIISRVRQNAGLCDEGRVLRFEGGENKTNAVALA